VRLIPKHSWNAKQSEEGAHIEAFLATYLPSATLELFAVDPDPPDFLARFSDGHVWHIEHTQLFRETPSGKRPMQEEEDRRDKVMSLAQKEYEKSQCHAVIVQPQFQDGFNIETSRLCETALRLAKIVLAAVPADGSEVKRSVYPHEFQTSLWPVGVAFLSVYRFAGQKESRWFGHGAEWAGQLTTRKLQEIIDRKGTRLRGRTQVDGIEEVLVLVLDESLHSSIIGSTEVFCGEFKSCFDKAFVWFHVQRRWQQLRLARVPVQNPKQQPHPSAQ
jgi:hypothetical protein